MNNILINALKEDIGQSDITSELTINKDQKIDFVINTREDIIVCGIDYAVDIFKYMCDDFKFKTEYKDGDIVKSGKNILTGSGNAIKILSAERVALNLMQHLSAISSKTAEFVKFSNKIKILDTRKTIIGIRELQKYAVKIGGGTNHRSRLDEAILIKDNHIALAGGIENALKRAKKSDKLIEVECDTIEQVKIASQMEADIIMLDNMSNEQILEALKYKNKSKIEVSGNINLERVKELSDYDIDFISIGSLTHSVKAVDIGLDIKYG